LQQVMKKKKKTSRKCYYVTYSFNRSRCFTSLCLAFESLPIQYKVSLMMIGAKISHGCIQSSQTHFCDVWSLLVHHTKKNISQTLNKGYKIFKNVMILGTTWRTHENLRLHLGTSHGTHWEPFKNLTNTFGNT
jgi:hypothetical protein